MSIHKKSIGIVGAGMAGLALAWYLSQYNTPTCPLSITLYDYQDIGKGTSGIAAGLLHPYAGKWATLNWRAVEAMVASLELLEVASQALGRPVAAPNTLLRLPTDTKQQAAFQHNASLHTDLLWWEQDQVTAAFPSITPSPGLCITSAYTVACQDYLEGLWRACQKQGVHLQKQRISSLTDIPCDIAIAATGYEKLPETEGSPLNQLKGQTILLKWPANLPPLSCPITKDVYLLPLANGTKCLVGATFERHFASSLPDAAGANYLIERASNICPALQAASIIQQDAGVRATTPLRRPFYQQIKGHPSCWIAAGLGSKGLLYHALYAAETAPKIIIALS